MTLNGKRPVLYAKTREEALQNLLKLQNMKLDGLLPDRSDRTVAQYLKEYIDDIAPDFLRPNTVLCYSDTIRLHINPWIGHLQLAKLSGADIRGMLKSMKKAGDSARMRQLA